MPTLARREFENAIHADRHGAKLAEAGARSRTTVQLQERIIVAVGSAHPALRCAARWTSSSSCASEIGVAGPSGRQTLRGPVIGLQSVRRLTMADRIDELRATAAQCL